MKNLITVLLCLLNYFDCMSQKIVSKLSTDTSDKPIYYHISSPRQSVKLFMTIDSNTNWIESQNTVPNQPNANYVFMGGAKDINLFMDIAKDSLPFYRYNIIENDQIWLAENATPKISNRTYIPKTTFWFNLGKFSISNKKLTIEVFKLSERNKVRSVTIYNKAIQPAERMFTALFINKNGQEAVEMENRKDDFSFRIQDSVTVSSVLLSIKPTELTFIYHVYLKNLSTGKTVHIGNNWAYGFIDRYAHMLINTAFFTNPGKYQVSIVPRLSSSFNAKSFPAKAVSFRFTVLRSPPVFTQKETFWLTIALLVIAGSVTASIGYLYRINNTKKLRHEQQQIEFAAMQLSAVRSQLNPHFMFNALSGIQNLMNRNEPDQANRYLTKFARLTRGVLNEDQLTSLKNETALLEDYLQMEQLRFGFQYHITADLRPDLQDIEIPAMLIQPLVENAVKHGVSSLNFKGEIRVEISQSMQNILILVTDNGPGFNLNDDENGHGLNLIRKRIKLLNTIYKNCPVILSFQTSANGTTATLTFSHWL